MEPQHGTHVARIRYRIGQGLSYLRPRDAAQIDARLRRLLRPEESALLDRLSVADRAHHLEVHDRLVRHGSGDEDLLTAALLHDVGKADGRMRVGLVSRTVAVLLDAVSLGMSRRFAAPTGRAWRRALDLTVHHAERGSELARAAGCSDRVCWIIAHHHDTNTEDEAIRLLQRADDGELR